MNTLSPLQPFAEAPAAVTVHAGVERHPDGLCLRYLLAGNLSALLLPPLQVAPSRKERLWESTCLECFFSRPDQAGYWEVNISPAGDWNVYGFSDYRQGMHEETAIDGVTVTVNDTVDTIAVTVALPTAGLFTGEAPLKAGLCVVLEEHSGRQSFWALAHPLGRPDFHHRCGLMLSL